MSQPGLHLRRRPKTTASCLHPRRDGIIPLRVECVTLDIEGLHLRVADLDALRVAAGIKLASDRQAGPGRGGGDQFDDCFAAGQGLASPGLSDVAEQPVLSSRAGGIYPRALLEPYLKLSLHTAPDVRPLTCRNPQWAKRFGAPRTTRANHFRAPFGR